MGEQDKSVTRRAGIPVQILWMGLDLSIQEAVLPSNWIFGPSHSAFSIQITAGREWSFPQTDPRDPLYVAARD